MKIINGTIFKTKMTIKAFGLFINGMNQDGSCADFLSGTQTSL